MTDGEQTEDDEGDASRKKLKQTHLQVFDTQSSTGKKGLITHLFCKMHQIIPLEAMVTTQ